MGATSRSEVLAAVMRAVADLDDTTAYGADGECRYHEVVYLLSSIDWGVMPIDVIRDVFLTVARKSPLAVLKRRPNERNLVEQAKHAVEYNAKLRLEMARDDSAFAETSN